MTDLKLLGSASVLALAATAFTLDSAFAQVLISDPYASFFGGANLVSDQSWTIDPMSAFLYDTSGAASYGKGVVAGGALGAQLLANLRGEVEVSYRHNSVSSYFEGTFTDNLASPGDYMSALALMANIWLDMPVNEQFSVHVGGGIGGAKLHLVMADIDEYGSGAAINSTAIVPAGQVGAGVSFGFGNGIVGSLDYRLMATAPATFMGSDSLSRSFSVSTNYVSQAVIAGLRVPIGGQ